MVFFNTHGIVHKEFVHTCQAVSGKFYCEVLKQLREGICLKHPDKWKNNNWFLYDDKAPAHTSLVVRHLLTSKNITLIPHPPIRLTSPLRLFSILQDECTAKRAPFWHDWADPHRIARKNRHTHIWELPGMHVIMGKKLGSLYTCPRGLLRRRSWKLGVTIRNFLIFKFTAFWVDSRMSLLWMIYSKTE